MSLWGVALVSSGLATARASTEAMAKNDLNMMGEMKIVDCWGVVERYDGVQEEYAPLPQPTPELTLYTQTNGALALRREHMVFHAPLRTGAGAV